MIFNVALKETKLKIYDHVVQTGVNLLILG